MNKEELKLRLAELLPSAVFEEGGEWTTVVIDPAAWEGFARESAVGRGA